MNDNGYIRKIDELGRVVIPKELRQRLKIHEGENLIINCNDKNINLSKYSYIENNTTFIRLLGDKVSLVTDFNVIITDLEHIIYSNKEFQDINIASSILKYVNLRESAILTELTLTSSDIIKGHISIEPIITNSLCIGLAIVYANTNSNFISKISKIIAGTVSVHLDIS